MKKSLLALAVLGAFAGVASAQSSVTIYGIIDASVAKLNNGTTPVGHLNGGPGNTVGQRNAWTLGPTTSNRLGFRGTEDLGGGLKANFQLEHRFRADDGTQEAATFWQGQSWVGLSGNFGEVRLGRQYVPAFYIGLNSDPWGYDYNVAGANAFTRGENPITRASNAVTYRSPNLSGFSAEAQVAAGEGGSAGGVTAPAGVTATAGRNIGANVQYGAGPLWAGLGYNDTKLNNAPSGMDHRYWVAAAAYDFGVVRPILSYSQSKAFATANTKSYLVGATAPLGSGRLKAVVARTNRPAGNPDTTKFGVGYEYFLSKRTSVHADVGSAKSTGLSRITGVEAGLKHVF